VLFLAAGTLSPLAARIPAAAPDPYGPQIIKSLAENRIASVSIAQISKGRLIRVAAYGDQSAGVPATPRTLYNIASLTKPLTAEVVLRLASRGRLSLDEPMDNAWIDPDLVKDPRHKLLTPRMALTHRTGLPNWRATGGLAFASDPGGAWSYSGEGFQYVARFAEARMHQPLDVLAQAYLFKPLGMKDSSYVGKPWFTGRIAVPTDAQGKWLEPNIAKRANAADLVYTTPRDYAAFMLAVLADKGLNNDIAKQRSTSQVSLMEIACKGKHADTCPPLVGFGLGWQLMEFPGETVLMHTGKDEGTFSFVYLNRTTKDGVVIFTNSDVGYKIVLPVLEQSGASPAFLRFLRGQMD
jgi:CubicO group peptidase (beta-lactamase class C family)